MNKRAMGHKSILERLEDSLKNKEPRGCPFPGLEEAAVAVPLFLEGQRLNLVLIRRSRSLRIHPGQIAFPGGRRSPWDKDLVSTGLRELREELGVRRERTKVLGCLDQEFTFSNYSVMPFVVEIRAPFSFKPNKEVEEVIILEIERLTTRNFLAEEHVFMGREVNSWRVETPHGTIWGATARILYGFLSILENLKDPL